MAADSRKDRNAFYRPTHNSDEITLPPIPTDLSTLDNLSSYMSLTTPEVDLYKRPTSPPLPAIPSSVPSKMPVDPKKETKSAQRLRREQAVLKLQQQQNEALEKHWREKLERQRVKQERKQKKDESKQMHQKQPDYQQQFDSERRSQQRQHDSLPIHTNPTAYSESPAQGNGTSIDLWGAPQSPSDVYYHSSRYYHRDRPDAGQHHSEVLHQHNQHLNSLSSTNSGSSQKTEGSEKTRSLSLKSHSTKSMYDLRPWSGSPQSPTFEYHSGYDSDDTSMSQGWDSLMDTLHSPTRVSSPLNSPDLDLSFKNEMEMDLVETSLAELDLSHEDNKNGNGKYLLVLGANGRTGIEIVKQGLALNYRVTAFVRNDRVLLEDSTLRKNQNLLIVRGSPTCQEDLDSCVEGQDVVVNVIGARLMSNDTTISSHSQVVLNNAMKKHGVRRLLVVTSYGCLGLRNYLINTKTLFSRVFMNGILKDKVLQEEIIQRDSVHLDWTIVRPITLKDGEPSGQYWFSSQELPTASKVKVLTRRDLAQCLLSIINVPEQHHAIRSIAGKAKPKGKNICSKLQKEVNEPRQMEGPDKKQLQQLEQQHPQQQQQQQ
ncbi:hypothetical protein BGZ99_002472 [Dissophora globulifera]|uniref:NAD(P)-binding domain-containing protein n=1 Tax=Dissophora globulifera TaxID=979702 RepID=A0A9P6UXJ1_9FUNG|nr:hypothetical protein BGZ99_002472 [Dissophora globulifera]